MNTKSVEEILQQNGFVLSDFDNVLKATSEILELAAQYTAQAEPHAIKSIERYRSIAAELSDPEIFAGSNNLFV